MIRNGVWALSNLCRGKNPPPNFSKVISINWQPSRSSWLIPKYVNVIDVRCLRVFLCLHACYFTPMLMCWLMLAGPFLIYQMARTKRFRLLSMLESVDVWLSFSCKFSVCFITVMYKRMSTFVWAFWVVTYIKIQCFDPWINWINEVYDTNEKLNENVSEKRAGCLWLVSFYWFSWAI